MSYVNYTQISNEILLSEQILPLAKVIFGVLNSFAQRNPNRTCRISLAKLSLFSNIGVKTVRKLIDVLIELGFVEVIKPEKGRCHSYRVHFTSSISNTSVLNLNELPSTTQPCSLVPTNNINTEKNIEDDNLEEQLKWNLSKLKA